MITVNNLKPSRRGRHRLSVLLSLLMVFALFAAACGSDDDDSTATDTDTSTDSSGGGSEGSGSGETDTGGTDTDDGDDMTEPADDTPDAPEDAGGDDMTEPAEGEGDDGDDGDEMEEPAVPEEPIVLTASYKGVTEEAIHVGVSMLDFEFLVSNNFSAAGWGNQQGVWEALIADLNARGGIYGREVVAVYDHYSPIGTVEAEETCAILTQDNEVFAVLGGFLGPFAGTVDPCIVGTNETMLVGGEINPSEYELAVAPWYDTTESTDQATNTLLDLMVQTGRADGAKVFVITNQAATADKPLVEQALADRGIELVESAIIDAPDGDQAAQDAISQVIYERFRSSDANRILLNGNPSAALRGMQQAGLEGSVQVWANDQAGLENLGTSVDRSRVFDTLTLSSATDLEMWADPAMQDCVAIVESALGVTVSSPAEAEEDEENWFNAVRRYCRLLRMFEHITLAAGPDLTYDSVREAIASGELSDFSLPGNPKNSLSATKPFGNDQFRLAQFDVNISDGGLSPLTDLIDIFN